MGFYGNITNTGRTHFQFDKIFANRAAMDYACLSGTDNIFAGRFVLVSYDPESRFTAGDILSGFMGSSSKIYADASHTILFYYTNFQQVQPSMANANNWNSYYWRVQDYYIKLPSQDYYNSEDGAAGNYWTPTAEGANDENKCFVTENQLIRLYNQDNVPTETFYKCVAGTDGEEAEWETLILSEFYPDYLINYNIDKETYGVDQALRGYDGTVWQKIYSEGKGKFILIARLNSLMPGLELFPDAPQILPSAPYIDSKSSEALYRIHVPSHWGFRIKESTPVVDPITEFSSYPFSDQVATRIRGRYGDNNELIETYEEEINADIYFNKQGANKEIKKYDDIRNNEIEITPTGASGKIYFDKDGNEVYIDTYEFSAHLPMIGNMVSDGYDLIYGAKLTPDEHGDILRYTDVSWIDGSQPQEVKYNGFDNKKTHDLGTLAGTLNTLHDRLGQIVFHLEEIPSQEQVNNLSFDYIYEARGTLYRRGIKYRKITIGDYIYKVDKNAGNHFGSNTYYTYDGVNDYGDPVYTVANTYVAGTIYYYREPWCRYDVDSNASTQFSTNKYYENSGTALSPIYIPSTDTTYNSTKTYYLKNINPSRFTEIELTRYEPNRFYYLDGESYICDISSPNPLDEHRTYYTITRPSQAENFANGYEPGKYYRINEETGAFEKDYSEIPDPLDNRPYYDVTNTTKTPTDAPCIFYMPNYFYYEEKAHPGNIQLCTEESLTQEMFRDYTFYVLVFSDTPKYGRDAQGNIIEYYEQIDAIPLSSAILRNRQANVTYYYISQDQNTIIPYENLPKIMKDPYRVARTYYTISTPTEYSISSLYLPGRYYQYDINSKNYTKANGPFDNEAIYYTLTSDNISVVRNPFYIQHKYYYEVSSNLYELADDPLMDMSKAPFYKKAGFYVENDAANECPHGYEWSEYAPYVPPSITLYAREEIPALISMDAAYAGDTTMSSINGALLYLHQSYDPLNDETRDTDTFRGSLNSIKDLLYQIKKLIPGRICYVNNFGQITSSDITYEQLKNLIT